MIPYQVNFYNLKSMYSICKNNKIPIIQWVTDVPNECREIIKTGFSRIISRSNEYEASEAIKRIHDTGWE